MSEKRFNIVSSEIVEGGKFIQDNDKEHSFPTTKDSASLIMYEKALNKLYDENEQLKQENKELRQYLCWEEMELEELEDINKNVIE